MPARHLLLVGSGHAHLHLVRQAHQLAEAGYRVTLLAPRWFDYSGSASAIAASGRDPGSGRLDVAALARGRVEHVVGVATAVDLAARTVLTDDPGATHHWDVVSFNIGSVAREIPGSAVPDSVVRIKPLQQLAGLHDLLRQPSGEGGHTVTVVGGGASGVELAGHLAIRSDVRLVRLLEAGPTLAASLPAGAGRRLAALLRRRGVAVHTGTGTTDVRADHTVLADGRRLDHDIAVLATGLAPPPLATRADLGGPDGIPVRATLQHRDHDDVYAVGDCADFLPHPLDRVGVHGVRQGPVLLDSLLARAAGQPVPSYHPQHAMLSVLDLGGGTAMAARGSHYWLGRSSLALKRWIDRRWLRAYRT